MARPSKLTPETHELIVKAISLGATYKDAAAAAGIGYDTFNNWMKRGMAAKRGKYFQFFNAVTKSEASCRVNFVAVIARAAKEGEWRAALEFLKRRDRETWGDNVDVTSGGDKLKIALTWRTFENEDDDARD